MHVVDHFYVALKVKLLKFKLKSEIFYKTM